MTAIAEFRDLMKIAIGKNFFQFCGRTFFFPDGLPMEVLSRHWSPKSLWPTLNRRYWMMVLYALSLLHVGWFSPLLSRSHPVFQCFLITLYFNFLDLTVSLLPQNLLLIPSFRIFREPTFTRVMINGPFFHQHTHRRASIFSLIHRLISSLPLCHAEFITELCTIENLAHKNYSP